jgi:hypothetical protein
MPVQNFLVEMSNDLATIRDEKGISRQRIADFITQHGNPTHLVGGFGEHGRMPDGGYSFQHIVGPFFLNGSRHVAFLERDSSWFPPDASEGME